jgi:hypothetical protein
MYTFRRIIYIVSIFRRNVRYVYIDLNRLFLDVYMLFLDVMHIYPAIFRINSRHTFRRIALLDAFTLGLLAIRSKR